MDIPEELRGKATIDLPTAARLLGISRPSAYKAVRAGQLPHLRIGTRVVVPVVPFLRMLGFAGQASAESAEAPAA